jgi:hypothetical protein
MFYGCRQLKEITLPSSLCEIDCRAFIGSSIANIRIDESNPFYFMSGDFLIESEGMTLFHYFGATEHVITFGECPSLANYSVINYGSMRTVDFEEHSRLTGIGDYAFCDCSALKSICIPASIESIGSACFHSCVALSQLTFEVNSKLSQIDPEAFASCSSLMSICIPAQVKYIPCQCFFFCTSLADLYFEPDSKLIQIYGGAFSECSALRQIIIPRQLDIMPSCLFRDCTLLSQLAFEAPSELKQLDLPPSEFGVLCIPDSVEIITGLVRRSKEQRRGLRFGPESHIRGIHFGESLPGCDRRYRQAETYTVFAYLSEESLRRFRCKFECF